MRLIICIFIILSACQNQPEVIDLRNKEEMILGLIDGNNQRGDCQLETYSPALSLTSDELSTTKLLEMLESSKAYKTFVNSLPEWADIKVDPKPFDYANNLYVLELHLLHKPSKISFCEVYGRAFQLSPDQFLIKGNFNVFDNAKNSSDLSFEFATDEQVLSAYDKIMTQQNWLQQTEKLPVYDKTPCVFINQKTKLLQAAWNIKFFIGHIPVSALIAQNELLSVEPLAFHLDGLARIYDRTKKESTALATVHLPNMSGRGYLCNDMFTTSVPTGIGMAFDKEFKYLYSTADKRFQETSLFANANEMWTYFTSLGFDNWAKAQIEIFIKNELEGGPSYINPDISSSVLRPRIYVTQGADKLGLKNLNTDFDVVGHELGHHIVSKYVGTARSDENRTLHEALADAFVMLYTNDPCLGETICAKGSSTCINDACLRTAENDLNYTKEPYTGYAWHKKSQLITGLLWDLNIKHKMDIKHLGQILAGAVRTLSKETNYSEFLNALLTSEAVVSGEGAENSCKIFTAIKDRGLEEKATKPNHC